MSRLSLQNCLNLFRHQIIIGRSEHLWRVLIFDHFILVSVVEHVLLQKVSFVKLRQLQCGVDSGLLHQIAVVCMVRRLTLSNKKKLLASLLFHQSATVGSSEVPWSIGCASHRQPEKLFPSKRRVTFPVQYLWLELSRDPPIFEDLLCFHKTASN